MFSVRFLGHFMENLTIEHLKCAKKMLRYVKSTIDFGETYKSIKILCLEGYNESDYVGDFVKRKNISCVIL